MPNDNTALPETKKRSPTQIIIRNTIFGLGTQFGMKLASLIFQIFVVRRLGGAQFGEYSSVLAWAGLFSVIGDLGVVQYLTREIARDPSKSKELFWDAVSLRLILGVVAIVITTGGAILWGYSSDVVFAIVIFTVSYIFQSLLQPLTSLLSGNERIDITSILAMLTQIVFYILATIFLISSQDFVWLAVAATLNVPIMGLIAWWFVRRNNLGPPQFHINPQMWPSLMRFGLPFALMQLSLSFSYQVDTVLLKKVVVDAQIGWYNIAYNVVFMIVGVMYSFTAATLPTLSREFANRADSISKWYYHSSRFLLFVGLPIAFGITVVGDKLIHLMYQPQIAPAAIPLIILIWDVPVVLYNGFCGNILQSMKLEGKAARVSLSLGAANIILNIILLPTFGIIGASFATVLTDVVGSLQYYVLLRRRLGPGLRFTSIFKATFAAACMFGLLYFLRSWNLFILIGLGAVIYLGLVWILGVYSREERTKLISSIRGYLPVKAQ